MKLLILITKGLIRDVTMRRGIMTGCVLAACSMLFAGSTFLDRFLAGQPWLFLAFWVVCAWLTLLSVLLALYDLLAVRAVARHERNRLKRKIFNEENERGEK